MRKIILTLTALLAFSFVFSQQAGKIKIGILHSTTGTMAISERSLVDAIKMAVEEINNRGGINGQLIEAIEEDGESDWDVFYRKARKLIEQDKVCSIFGCWTSASRKAVLPVVEQAGNLLWYPVQYEGGESSRNIIYSGAAPNQQILPAIDWSLKNLGKRYFLVGSDYTFPREANRIVKAYLAQQHGEVVGEEYLPLGNQNFNRIVEMIKEEKPDVIFNTVNGSSNIGLFLELNTSIDTAKNPQKIPVVSVSLAEDELRSMGTMLTVGNYSAWNYFQSIPSDANRKFVAAFRQRYGQERVTSDPIEAAYFQVYLFAEALRKAGSPDPALIRKEVLGLTMQAPGNEIKIDAENQHAWKYARIGKILTDGQFDIIWSSSSPIKPDPYPSIVFPRGEISGLEREKTYQALALRLNNAMTPLNKINVLKDLLDSRDNESIVFAFDKLKELKLYSPQLLTSLEALAKSDDIFISQCAIDAIGQSGEEAKQAIPVLIDLLDYPRVGIRFRAQEVITSLAIQLREERNTTYLSALRSALGKMEKDKGMAAQNNYASLRQSIEHLEDIDKARLFQGVSENILSNPWLIALIIYTGLLLLCWQIILRFFPAWILRMNYHMKTSISLKLFGNMDASVPLRYIFIVGWFRHSPKVLDAWVHLNIKTARNNFNKLDTVRNRDIYIPAPVTIDQKEQADIKPKDLFHTCSQDRWCILIYGEGGKGKTALACQIAKWSMEELEEERLSRKNLAIPVLIEPGSSTGADVSDMDSFLKKILGQLKAIIGTSENISPELLLALLRSKRILVIVDDVSVMTDSKWSLPSSSEFPVSGLIVTSRIKEELGKIPHTLIEPLWISGERLSSFMDSYLSRKGFRQQFSDIEFFESCQKLSILMRDKNNKLTALFAKMYADQMIGVKDSAFSSRLPNNIPDLMLGFLDELNRNRTSTYFDNRAVQIAVKKIAWECCRQGLHAGTAPLDDVEKLLGTEAKNLRHHLESELRITQVTGPAHDKIKFSIDPLAEYCAGLFLIHSLKNNLAKWEEFLQRLQQPGIMDSTARGFILALIDCVRVKSLEEGVPPVVLTKLLLVAKAEQGELGKIKVGILHSMTGSMAISERSLVDSIKLAIDEINETGGILGRQIHPIVEDGASNWDIFASKSKKLITEEGVCSVFGCWTSSSRKAVLPVFEEYNNLLWYPIQYEGGESSPNIIYTGAAPNQQILPAVEWCLEHIGKKIFLVGSDYIFPREANKLIKKFLEKRQLQPCGEAYIPLGDRDFDEVIKKIKELKPDVIFNTVNGDSNMGLFAALHKAGIDAAKIPVMSVSIAEVELASIGKELTTGHYCAWSYFQSIDTPENQLFVNTFKKANGMDRTTDDPIESSYTQVKLFAKAVTEAGSVNPVDIRNAAKGMIFQAPGGMIKIDPENQHTWKMARIGKIMADGQFEIVWTSPELIRPNPYPDLE